MEKSPQSSSLSLHSYTPGAHRRSHPNLHHLSFAPLTPKYPVNPSDYEAYVDPYTNTLHSSASLTQIASVPSPGRVLSVPPTPNGTRSPRHHRRVRSNIHLDNVGTLTTGTRTNTTGSLELPSGAVTSAGFGGRIRTSTSGHHKRLSHPYDALPDSSWLIHTALHLTDSSRESKGQSWLSKRESSTSLHSPSVLSPSVISAGNQSEYFSPRSGRASARNTPAGSRRGSRSRGGGPGRRELRMTSIPGVGTGIKDMTSPPVSAAAAKLASVVVARSKARNPSDSSMNIKPNWTDPATQAEARASDPDFVHNITATGATADDEDYDAIYDSATEIQSISSEDEGDSEDEREIQRQVKQGRGFIFGRWVDNVVDALLMFEDPADDDGSLEADNDNDSRNNDVENGNFNRNSLEFASGTGVSTPSRATLGFSPDAKDILSDLENAPQNPASTWEDVKYVGRLIWGTPIL